VELQQKLLVGQELVMEIMEVEAEQVQVRNLVAVAVVLVALEQMQELVSAVMVEVVQILLPLG
jgi:hypothetical protein